MPSAKPFVRLLPAALLCLLTLAFPPDSIGAPVRLPAVPENPDLGWVRQPFFESLPPWDLDPILFPPGSRDLPPRPEGAVAGAWDLLRQGFEKSKEAEGKGGSHAREDAARLFLRAYASDKGGAVGFLALRLAARSYFLGGHYNEAAGVATTLVGRSGGRGAELPFYLLKGEALYQKRDLLAARECFRRASAGKFPPHVKTRIELRIADASLELGNVAYAEPAYRKGLAGASAQRKLPFNAIRFGEAMIASGKTAEAAALFRSLDTDADGVPPLARAVALLGAGDAALLSGALVDAQTAYMKAGSIGNFPETRPLLKLRLADLAFAGGRRAEALSGYGALAGSAVRSIAREARYKQAVTLYLQGDFAGAIREAEGWTSRHAGKPGEKGMRALSARAGADLVRSAGKANPADRWPALSSFLFAYGRTKEWPVLLGEIGNEWEDARIWDGAADLYASAGDAPRSADMRRVARAESAYYRGDFPAVFAELGWSTPSKERVPGGAWIAAKTYFRQGRYPEADSALRRLAALRGGTPSPAGDNAASFPPERELASFSRALQGKWAELRDDLEGVPPQPAVPGLSVLKSVADARSGEAKPADNAAKAPPAGDLYAEYLRVRGRVERIHAEDGAP